LPGELKRIGQLGEDLAVRFLLASGAEIVDRNVRPGTGHGVRGELDILCIDGVTLCVVEVKTLRRRGSGMTPGMNVTAAKQHQIVMLTQLWLAQNPLPDEIGIRFDVIEVTLGTRGTPDIVWHQGAYLAS
jgi:putative endonuclease